MCMYVQNATHVFVIPLHVSSVETEDYTIDSATTVTFNSGTTMNGDTACVNVGIEDDDNYEEDQMFSVSIGTLTPASAAMTGFPNTMTKTLQDNEGVSATVGSPITGSHYKHTLLPRIFVQMPWPLLPNLSFAAVKRLETFPSV